MLCAQEQSACIIGTPTTAVVYDWYIYFLNHLIQIDYIMCDGKKDLISDSVLLTRGKDVKTEK